MANKAQTIQKSKQQKGGNVLPTLCRMLGLIILLAVIIACLPVTIPQFIGYQVFNVVSGSMEPTIPVGSVIYVKPIDPDQVKDGDIIAFHSGESVIMHRVVDNYVVEGYFKTKGDANEIEDLTQIPYEDLIGIGEKHYPALGEIMVLLASGIGKACMLSAAGCGALLMLLGVRLAQERWEEILIQEALQQEREKKAARQREKDKIASMKREQDKKVSRQREAESQTENRHTRTE